MTGTAFSIGESNHERLEVRVFGYERQPRGEYYDDNWLAVEVSLSAGGFRGNFQASFLTSELVGFHEQLAALYKTLVGEAKLVTMEAQLRLTLTGNGRGGIQLKGEAWDQPGIGNQLLFGLDLDQTHLGKALEELHAVVERYPVRVG